MKIDHVLCEQNQATNYLANLASKEGRNWKEIKKRLPGILDVLLDDGLEYYCEKPMRLFFRFPSL